MTKDNPSRVEPEPCVGASEKLELPVSDALVVGQSVVIRRLGQKLEGTIIAELSQ